MFFFNKITDKTKYRVLEIIPGSMVWGTFIILGLLAFIKTSWAIYFIIVFDVYWLVRICYMLIHLIFAWRKYGKDVKIDWLDKVKKEKAEKWEDINIADIFRATRCA